MIKLSSMLVLAGIVGFLVVNSENLERDVKSGKAELYCLIGDTEKKIDPKLIEYRINDYWKFSNGGASNCQVK